MFESVWVKSAAFADYGELESFLKEAGASKTAEILGGRS